MDRIRQFVLDQIAEQSAEADRHLADSYWTDGRTGRNIGLDERQALGFLRSIALDPTAEEENDPELYLARLLCDLEAVGDRFRMEAPDPDGYGIATIGTVARKLAAFGTG